jgi:AraC family transcriptional regulator, transcriptional activator FtrA
MTTGPRVVVLAYDGLCTFEFGIASEIFGLNRPEMGENWYQFSVCAAEPGPLRAHGLLQIAVDKGLEALEKADLIIVPGWKSIEAAVPQSLIDALVAAHARGARLASLCSGIVVMAATGLLDGRKATTHWRYIDSARRRFSKVEFTPAVLYVDNGDMLTAAGSAAGIDMCLHIVRKDFGAKAANLVAKRLVVQPHREGGQAQFIDAPVSSAALRTSISAALDYVRQHPGRNHTVQDLAVRLGMSERTFQRKFFAATGKTPKDWIIHERVQVAKNLLESEDLSLDDISQRCGFGAPETMRHHFRYLVGMSPGAYRKRFSCAGPISAAP